jgi:hypothetical protein
VNSVLFIGGAALVFTVLGMLGVGEQEAFQVLDNAAGVLYGLTYLVLFAVPLVGLVRTSRRAPVWIRIAAGIGFLTTALYIVLSVLPIVAVESRLLYAVKIGGTVVVVNLVGGVLYLARRPRTDVTSGTQVV